MRVLVIDENRDSVLVLARLLQRLGHQIEAARQGSEALRLASVFLPDVVFLDLWMEGIDSYEVAQRLRRIEGMSEVRIVAITDGGPDSSREQAARFNAHLPKPIGLKQLAATIGADNFARN
jgi:CheY-like chemotaxis protein